LSVTKVAISNDNTIVVTASADKTAKVWDLNLGKLIYTLSGHAYILTSLAISSYCDKAVTGCLDGKAIIWDLKSG